MFTGIKLSICLQIFLLTARWEQTKFFRIDVSGVEKLRSQNTEEVWRGAVDILIRLLTNIQREPSNTR